MPDLRATDRKALLPIAVLFPPAWHNQSDPATMQPFPRTLICTALILITQGAFAQLLATKFDPKRDAAADLVSAQTLAGFTGKRILVDVGGEWCRWCRMFDKFVASQPDIKTRIESNFVWIKVNYSAENKNVDVLSRWPKARGYPYFVVLEETGRLLHVQAIQGLETETENESEEGYDPARVMAFLKRFSH
jgi:hypothetical protein